MKVLRFVARATKFALRAIISFLAWMTAENSFRGGPDPEHMKGLHDNMPYANRYLDGERPSPRDSRPRHRDRD